MGQCLALGPWFLAGEGLVPSGNQLQGTGITGKVTQGPRSSLKFVWTSGEDSQALAHCGAAVDLGYSQSSQVWDGLL